MKIEGDDCFSISSYLSLLGDPEFTRSGCNPFALAICRTFAASVLNPLSCELCFPEALSRCDGKACNLSLSKSCVLFKIEPQSLLKTQLSLVQFPP